MWSESASPVEMLHLVCYASGNIQWIGKTRGPRMVEGVEVL